MEYLHEFTTQAQLISYMDGEEYKEPFVALTDETTGVTYNKVKNPLEQPLTFNITSPGHINWGCIGEVGESAATIEYSKNGGEWTSITATPIDPYEKTGGTNISVSAGDIVRFRGDNNTYEYQDELNYGSFSVSTCGFNLEGNIMSLIDSTNFSSITAMTTNNNMAFAYMFNGCSGLASAENLLLPATTLAENCYYNMFNGCTSLTTAPSILPATTLATSCYQNMFQDCTSLTTAPELPATTLAEGCYSGMFYGCTSLTTAPELPATTLANSCYDAMFYGCTSLTTAPGLPATTLANHCYNGMFQGCTGLTTAPVLPATTLAENCYYNMFNGCTGLTTAPELPATTLAESCYYSMFYGCTSLTTAPVLSATTLVKSCYRQMFWNCRSLKYIKCLATNISALFCTHNWVNGVGGNGTFVKNPNMTKWEKASTSGIPYTWTVEDAS